MTLLDRIFKFLAVLLFAVCASSLNGQFEIQGQMGKRWLESQGNIHGSERSLILATHGLYRVNTLLTLFVGPSFANDRFGSRDNCQQNACFSADHYKVGIDFGTEFEFPLVSIILQVRTIAYGWGRESVWGKTALNFPPPGPLTVFQGGTQQGEFLMRTRGIDFSGALKWHLVKDLSLLVSFEFASEKIRVDQAKFEVSTQRGDSLALSSSLHTDWIRSPSSALFAGLSYTL